MTGWAFSRYTGLFVEDGPHDPRPHDPRIEIFSAVLARGHRDHPEYTVGGAGWSRDEARLACLGEAIERLRTAPEGPDRIVESPFARWSLKEPAAEPESWILHSREQYESPGFPLSPLDRDTVCRWVCFRDVRDHRPRWIPIEMAFVEQDRGCPHQIFHSTSTGLCAGRWGDPVLLRGLQEVLERDAVTAAWLGAYDLVEYDREEVLAALGTRVANRIVRPNLTYRFYGVETPYSAHVTIVTLQGEDDLGFCFSTGSACRLDRRSSWLKAILEAVQGRHLVRHLRTTRTGDGSGPPATFSDHAFYYSQDPGRLQETVLARARAGTDPLAGPPETLDGLLAKLGQRPVLFRNMTPPDLAQVAREWYVLKVVVPGLQPLHGDHALAHLGGPAWAGRTLAQWRAYPPHPFA